MSNESRPPLAFSYVGHRIRAFLPEEAKPAIRFCVHIATVYIETLGDRGLQLRYSPSSISTDVRGCASTAVHYPRTFSRYKLESAMNLVPVSSYSVHLGDSPLSMPVFDTLMKSL